MSCFLAPLIAIFSCIGIHKAEYKSIVAIFAIILFHQLMTFLVIGLGMFVAPYIPGKLCQKIGQASCENEVGRDATLQGNIRIGQSLELSEDFFAYSFLNQLKRE